MRRILGMGALAGLAVFVLAQVSGTSLLDGYAKALNSATSVHAVFTVQKPIGSSAAYQIDFAKPNKVRIDSPGQLVIADGKTITTYDKGDNSYYKKPQTDEDFNGLFASDDLALVGAFFDANYFRHVVSSKSAGTRNRKGITYSVVDAKMDKDGRKTVSFYLDPNDKMARVADILCIDGKNTDDTIVAAKEFTVNGDSGQAFTFKAPEDAKEISLEEINAGKWYTTWAEASAMARKTNKPIFIDFYTDWCHWCKVLDAEVYPTAAFRAEAKNWVLLKIDAEKGEGIDMAAKYQVSGYPTIKFVKADGTDIGGFVGYKPTDEVVQTMQKGH